MAGKFKLILGSGFKDDKKALDLALLWAKAGVDIIDSSPNVLPYLIEGFKKEGLNLNDFEFCISYPIKGDAHGAKAKINSHECKLCKKCEKTCIQNAINPPNIDKLKCIGCKHCKKACKYNAISFYEENDNALYELLKTDYKPDTIELHISIKDKKLIKKEIKNLIKTIDPDIKISLCFNRTYFSNQKTEKFLSKMKEILGNRKLVIQADGNSMNNAQNTVASTIETVAFGLFIKSLGYDVILSGGTNEYTSKLTKDAGLIADIAYGSYARNLVSNLPYDEALTVAKDFVSRVKNA